MTEDLEPNYLDNLDLEIDQEVTAAVREASRWAKFISILVFIFCGFMVIVLWIMSGSFMEGFSKSLKRYNGFLEGIDGRFFLIIIILALLFFMALYYFLFNFSRKTKTALATENIDQMNKGFDSLKIYFIIYSVLGILGIISSIVSLFKLL